MRDQIERFVLLPFSMGCVSESSIAVGEQFPNRSKHKANSTPTRIPKDEEEYEDDEESLSGENLKNPLSLLSAPKFQRIFKNFKNFSQLVVYKDDEMEEDDMGMEIGFPTDVKHVTHIGIDGSATSILSKRWDNLKAPEPHAPAPVHLIPSELAMPTQPDKQIYQGPSRTAHQEECNAANN